MLVRYGLKIVEYMLYGIAVLAFLEVIRVQSTDREMANTLIGMIFLLGGLGVLVPRIIAYRSWPKVIAEVGTHRGTLDGEKSAPYSYEFGNQRYSGHYRSTWSSPRVSRLQICVNPHAPGVRYIVIWNVWFFGFMMLCFGAFMLVTGIQVFG